MSNYQTFQFKPSDGLLNMNAYETRPASEQRTREILSDMSFQLRDYLNGTLLSALDGEHGALRSTNGATLIGAGPLATGYPETVQGALEQLHTEMQQIVLGTVSDDSISSEKLAPEVRARLSTTAGVPDETAQYTLFPGTMTAAARTAFEADAAKMADYTASRLHQLIPVIGRYVGNGSYDSSAGTYTNGTRTITLGFTPSAVLVLYQGSAMLTSNSYTIGSPSTYAVLGGLALPGSPAMGNAVEVVSNGFRVKFALSTGTWSGNYITNENGTTYHYIAWR